MSDLAEQVERGAALLDEQRPGWWDEVDEDDLDVGDCEWCVVALLDAVRLTTVGVSALDLSYGVAKAHGFEGSVDDCAAMAPLWRAAIERRRTEAPT
jgi:hypothetical protein